MQSYSNEDSTVAVQKQIERPMEQKEPSMKSCFYGRSVYDKGKEYTMRKESLFNKWSWVNWTDTCKRMQFLHCMKNKLKMD